MRKDNIKQEIAYSIFQWIPFYEDKRSCLINRENINSLEGEYDLIFADQIIDSSQAPLKTLDFLSDHLTENGILYFSSINRLAIKNFCGDKDPYSQKNLIMLEKNYGTTEKSLLSWGGRIYDRMQLENILKASNFTEYVFYDVFPTIFRPQLLYRDGVEMEEEELTGIPNVYESPQTIFAFEKNLYKNLIQNKILGTMSNGFLIACFKNKSVNQKSKADKVIIEYRHADCTRATIYNESGRRCIWSGDTSSRENKSTYVDKLLEAKDKVSKAQKELSELDFPVLEAGWEEYAANYDLTQSAEDGLKYLCGILQQDEALFIDKIKDFYKLICESSAHIDYKKIDWTSFDPDCKKRKPDDPSQKIWKEMAQNQNDLGPILEKGYFDICPRHCFYADGNWSFFDIETGVECCPAKAILLHAINQVYQYCPNPICPRMEMLEKLGLKEREDMFGRFIHAFYEKTSDVDVIADLFKENEADWHNIAKNRARMNYSEEQYNNFFNNIFRNLGNKQIYLFGSGIYTKSFLEKYREELQVTAILDNNSARWGQFMEDIQILSPEALRDVKSPFKVFICIKDYAAVLDQLQGMNVTNIAIYDPAVDNELPVVRKSGIETDNTNQQSRKPYDVGYVAGVFDMFHVGHLNILRRAKEQCNYLIVGLVSDRQIRDKKGTNPVICFEDRKAIVEACRFVDEVVEIPYEHPSTEDAWRLYHFDAQFSGSDYADDPYWLGQQALLRQHGADLIFFPYTEKVSTTQLKHEIGKL